MKMKKVFEWDMSGNGEPWKPEDPNRGGIPNDVEGIHDHLAAKFKGSIFRGAGTPVKMADGSSANLRSSHGGPTTTTFQGSGKKITNHLLKNGWRWAHGFPEGVHDDMVLAHHENDHLVHLNPGWDGEVEMGVTKRTGPIVHDVIHTSLEAHNEYYEKEYKQKPWPAGEILKGNRSGKISTLSPSSKGES